jgi:hypothetical protein
MVLAIVLKGLDVRPIGIEHGEDVSNLSLAVSGEFVDAAYREDRNREMFHEAGPAGGVAAIGRSTFRVSRNEPLI